LTNNIGDLLSISTDTLVFTKT